MSNFYEKDLRTTYGKNLAKISTLCDVSLTELTPGLVKAKMKYFPLPKNEEWRSPALMDLLDVRKSHMDLEGFDHQDINQMIVVVEAYCLAK